jgi:hypothetical protein
VSDFNYWRQRLLILEEEFDKSERATILSYLSDRRNPRQWAIGMVTVLGFIIAIIALIATLLATVYGGKSVQEAKVANAMASNASTSANNSSPVTIVVCCNSTTNSSMAITSSGIHTTSNATSESVITVTVLALTTTTVSVTVDLTSTISLTLSVTS